MDDRRPINHPHPGHTESAPELTASGLVYLFASELVPMVRPWTIGNRVMVPCRNIEVRRRPLAALLIATSLWSLRQRGTIRLEMYEEPTGIPFRKRRRIHIEAARQEQAHHQGLELVIMANLPTSGCTNASSLIHRFCLKHRIKNPWYAVVAVAADEVCSVRQDCGKLGSVQGAYQDFARQWQHFQVNEPMLYKSLLNECARSIASVASIIGTSGGTDGGLGDIVSDFFDGDFDGDFDFD